ncbi:Phenol degradation protein meta [Azospirillaceae bacterium]
MLRIKKIFLGATMLAMATGSTSALATEAASQYPDGAEGLMAGAVPPPGLYLLNYLTHYTADRLNDKSGNKAPTSISLNATAEVVRLLYVSEFTILGANLGAHILLPIVSLDYRLPGLSFHRTGLGDITIDPFILSWHFKNFHIATGLDFILPTGEYDRSKPLNIGANHLGIEPLVAGTYLSDSGAEVSAKLMYAFNLENPDTHYTSGQAFHTDFAVAQHFNSWTLGVAGYWFKQTTDDKAAGVIDGNRGMALAFGPSVKYDFGSMSLNGTWHHEVVTENRPQGDKFWLKFIAKF